MVHHRLNPAGCRRTKLQQATCVRVWTNSNQRKRHARGISSSTQSSYSKAKRCPTPIAITPSQVPLAYLRLTHLPLHRCFAPHRFCPPWSHPIAVPSSSSRTPGFWAFCSSECLFPEASWSSSIQLFFSFVRLSSLDNLHLSDFDFCCLYLWI